MSLRSPPPSLVAPKFVALNKGELAHRIHDSKFGGADFNPCAGRASRFAPIRDATGACIPSLYAASSLDAAIFETIFHDVAAKSAVKSVPMQQIRIRSHTVLELNRSLKLVELNNPYLKKWGLRHQDLIAASPKLYAQTAEWAKAIHVQFAAADGLIWASNQYTAESARLFFGDRVSTADFKISSTRDGAVDKTFLADVRTAGAAAGIAITALP